MTHNVRPELAALLVPIDRLRPHPDNPNNGDTDAIVESLRRNGLYRPVVAWRQPDGTGIILAGNHTYAAALTLRWTHLAATWVDADDPDDARRIMLADNRYAQLARMDDGALADLLQSLDTLDGTGYTDPDLDELLRSIGEPLDAGAEPTDTTPPAPSRPRTTRGDVWILGDHRVMCGDARSPDDTRKLLAGAPVHIAFTSPPYAAQRAYDPSSGFTPIPPDRYVEWFEAVQANIRSVLAPDGSWLVNIKEHTEDGQRSLYVKDLALAHVRRWGWRLVDELCWVDAANGVPGRWPCRFKNAWEPIYHYTLQKKIKFNPWANAHDTVRAFTYDPVKAKTPESGTRFTTGSHEGRHGRALPSNVLTIAAAYAAARGLVHAALFPVALPRWVIRAYSDPRDVVYDPFLGAGTSILAAHVEDRRGHGMELSPTYVDVTCRRWQEHTGTLPVHADTGQPHDFTRPLDT